MPDIQRYGEFPRWSDVIVHNHVAHWVEVADDSSQDSRGQIEQVLQQIDGTLTRLGGTKKNLLQVLIYLADLQDITVLNELWDGWIIPGKAPVRACVQAGLGVNCRVEMVITAATM